MYLNCLLHNWEENESCVVSDSCELEGRKKMVKQRTSTFKKNHNSWGSQKFIDYDELIDVQNGFIQNDSIKVTIKFTAEVPQFT